MKKDKDISKVEEDILSGLDRLDALLDEYEKMIWKNGMKSAYKNGGINDPDYCVLKFIAKSGRYYSWFKTETFEI